MSDSNEWLIPSINLSASALSFDEFLQDRPTQDELCNHILISDWRLLAGFLEIANVDIEVVAEETGNIASLALQQTFQLWLKKFPNASRQKILEKLCSIGQNRIAKEYKSALKKLYSEFLNCNIYCNVVCMATILILIFYSMTFGKIMENYLSLNVVCNSSEFEKEIWVFR